MKQALLILLLCCSFVWGQTQLTFTSIEQKKYVRGKELEFIGGSRYLVEIIFELEEGYILLKNKDMNFENKFINLVHTGDKNNKFSWRAYSNDTKTAYLIRLHSPTKDDMYVVLDDYKVVTYLKVSKFGANK